MRLIGFLLFMFFPASSFAGLVGSKHDLSVLGGEPCAYCHSVHNNVGGLGRPGYMGETLPNIVDIYDSFTMDHNSTIIEVDNSDAPLCLTCHDATFANDNLGAPGAQIYALINGTSMDIGLGLSNDHPTGFVFDALKDLKIKAPINPNVHVTFGPNRNEMWCSTCHNVHGGVSGTPFLSMSNSNSDLCLECHVK